MYFELKKSMVLSAGKNPGFSGTDFKHRKGFEKIKAIHDKEVRIGNSVVRGWEKPQTSIALKSFRIGFALFSISGLAFIVLMLVNRQQSIFIHYSKSHYSKVDETKKRMESEKSENAFSILMNSGTGLLRQNYLEDAQGEVTLALKIKPTDPKANLLMAEILIKKCQSFQLNCEKASDYLAALPHLKGINKNEISAMTKMSLNY